MKRSEMLEKLYDAVDEFFGNNDFGLEFELCDFLLKRAEELGMRPPDINLKEGEQLTAWEAEDEKD